MNLGRNDPCPCAKKYGKCCLPRGEEAKCATQAKPTAQAAPASLTARQCAIPKPPPDPRIEACDNRWSEFEAEP